MLLEDLILRIKNERSHIEFYNLKPEILKYLEQINIKPDRAKKESDK